MELNAEQKKAVFCAGNAVVAAGAGSGKTMVLANRFAWLLTEKGYKVDEILTLTFTKKAAAQMFRRIHSLISEIAEKETGLKAKRAQEALDDFIHSRIQTLDSYGASLVKQCAPRYGISPDFQIDQERCRSLALEVSYPFFIEHRRHPAIEKLYSSDGPNDIVRNIFADVLFNYCRIDKPRDFTADIKTQFNYICIEWKKQIDEIKTILKEMENDILENNDFLPDLVPLMEKYGKEKKDIPALSDMQDYFSLLLNTQAELCIEKAEAHSLRKSMAAFLEFLTVINNLNLRKGKRSDNPVKENVKLIRNLLNPVLSLAISCMQAGFIISITSLLTELQNRYLLRKRTEGILTFHDVAYLSRTILIEQEDVRQSEKDSFKAIMIDEFQDNNELQKDLLFLLAEKKEIINKGIPPAEDLREGKLFFVGDEKQSIYLFRGADVSVFRKLKDELKSADLPLKINYRSAPALIEAFNVIFGGSSYSLKGKAALSASPSVFAPSKELPVYEAAYTPLEAASVHSESKTDGSFSLCIFNKKSSKEDPANEKVELLAADENEARFIAEKIRKLLDEKTKGDKPKYQGDDIAILFRTRSSQYLYEKHLRLLDIPYTCEDINDLFYAGPVNDIMSVLRLAAHPLDSASYAEMLRSPFAGLSLSGTALCLTIYREAENPVPFDGEPPEELDETDREKYLYGQKIYLSICEKAETENISSLVSELWYKEGYRYETEWNPQTSVYRELYDYLFHLAVNADEENQGLASFTDSMRSFRDSGGQLSEVEIPLEHPGAVRLMTIHKSKGLEFPVVFLCGCGKRSQTDSCDVVYFSDETGIVFSPPVPPECRAISGKRNNFFWQRASEETKRKRTAELRRLLYVGMTRAEKELYITGSLEIKEPEDPSVLEDFPLTLKNHVNEKLADNENYIEGDSILDNDTFFGLLLPSIVNHIPGDFINIEEIPAYTEEYIRKQVSKNSNLTNDQKGLNEFLKKAKPLYKKLQAIKTPVIQDNHRTPVSLRNAGKEDTEPANFFINRDFSGSKSDDVFKRVDSLLERFSTNNDESTEKFNSGSFGTIAHICVEAYLNKEEPVIPSNIGGYLTPHEFDTLLEAGMELARRFVDSPLGKIAEGARLRESEFSFRSLIRNKTGNEVFINGTIDLFFEDKDCIHVVDFKTDNREVPAEHAAQMACYYQAVLSLFALPAKKDCRVWLYYLRTGHAVEVTEKAKNFNLENRVFS